MEVVLSQMEELMLGVRWSESRKRLPKWRRGRAAEKDSFWRDGV